MVVCVFVLGRSSHGYSPDGEVIQLERPTTLPSGAKFSRSKSDRFASLRKNLFSKRNDTAVRNSETALSDDELNQSKESKKKKRGLFSFGRKKK
ncbi:Serum amyloid A-2 protein [Dirofilaria immitis]